MTFDKTLTNSNAIETSIKQLIQTWHNHFEVILKASNSNIAYWFSPKACFIWAVIGICLHKCGFSLSKYFHSVLALSLGQPSCCSAMWAPMIGFCQYSWLHTAQTNGLIFTWWYMQWSYRIFFWWKALSGHRVHLNLFSLMCAISTWVFRAYLFLNFFSHTLQVSSGISCESFIWALRVISFLSLVPQMLHT